MPTLFFRFVTGLSWSTAKLSTLSPWAITKMATCLATLATLAIRCVQVIHFMQFRFVFRPQFYLVFQEPVYNPLALGPVPDPLLAIAGSGPLPPRRRRRLSARRRILRKRLRNLLLGLNTSGDRIRPDTLFSDGGKRPFLSSIQNPFHKTCSPALP